MMKAAIIWIYLSVLFIGQSTAETPDIWTAIVTENLSAIKQKAKSGTGLDVREPKGGSTPLIVAALLGKIGSARALIANGAKLDIQNNDGGTALHASAFFCRTEIVKLLLEKGANVNIKNTRSETALDNVTDPWSQELEGVYLFFEGLLEIQLNLDRIKATRPKVAALIRKAGGKTGRDPSIKKKRYKPIVKIKPTTIQGSYFVNGEIHVNTYGTPEGKPVTTGHQDFKPSWSKTDDMLIFFRRIKYHRVTVKWITAICIINANGTGFHQLTDGTHTDFNQTWTRDGFNTPIWNRKNPETGAFYVMQGKVGNKPGQEIALTDKNYHTWAYTCLMDGRILVQSAHPKQSWGYFLMTRGKDGEKPRFERIDCELAKKGLLDRISVSPSEKRVCFEYQTGFKYKDTGRTLYIADFNSSRRTITNPKVIANELAKPHWYAYPRWTKDETAVVFHANKTGKGALYLYTLKDGSTKKVSTNDENDYRYPHCEDTPK